MKHAQTLIFAESDEQKVSKIGSSIKNTAVIDEASSKKTFEQAATSTLKLPLPEPRGEITSLSRIDNDIISEEDDKKSLKEANSPSRVVIEGKDF